MERLYQTTVETPSGTTPDAPQSTVLPLEDSILGTVTIIIPDGHSGLTGIRVLYAQQEIIPWSNDDWLVSNDEKIEVGFNDQVTASGLTIVTYNLDVFPHKHWVRAQISDLTGSNTVAAATPSPIPSVVLSNLPG
jgi:hypothetical protein